MASENEKDKKIQLQELYIWISTIPLSKPTKNLTRDFADAVMMSEILKIYFPRFVDLHNYAPANSLTAKTENWNILNRKVLSKIDMKLTKDVILQLANCHPGVAEHVLFELKKKLFKHSEHRDPSNLLCANRENDSIEEDGKAVEPDTTAVTPEKLTPCPSDESTLKTLHYRGTAFANVTEGFYFVLMWLISWFYIWKYFTDINFRLKNRFRNSPKGDAEASGTRSTSENINEEGAVPRHVCAQLKQELHEIDDVICTLNHKVAYLESAMKLKDQRISNLTSQILQNTVESEQLVKTQTNVARIKLRSQSQNVREKGKIEE